MRLAGALLLLVMPARLPAQLAFTFSAGVRYSTVLVHDQIVTPFAVRPALAPAFALTAALPLDPPWHVAAVFDLSTSEVRREDQDGSTQPITHLSTAALGLGLTRSLKPWLSGSLRIGVLKYFPSQDLGLFQDGGPYFPFAQVAFDFRPPFASRYGVGLEVRADAHKFITDALRVEGFSDARPVARWALALTWTPGARP
jgi:hypothetical protein